MGELLRFGHYDVPPGGVRYVTLTGEADLSTVVQLQHSLQSLLAPQWITHLVLNLKTLRFLDCAAFSALLRVRKTALTRGQRVTVAAAQGGPARVIALSGSGHLFDHAQAVAVDRSRSASVGRSRVGLGHRGTAPTLPIA